MITTLKLLQLKTILKEKVSMFCSRFNFFLFCFLFQVFLFVCCCWLFKLWATMQFDRSSFPNGHVMWWNSVCSYFSLLIKVALHFWMFPLLQTWSADRRIISRVHSRASPTFSALPIRCVSDQALRDRLVCGLRNESTQWILGEADITLAKAMDIALGREAAERNTGGNRSHPS